jgi:hypothetical protein
MKDLYFITSHSSNAKSFHSIHVLLSPIQSKNLTLEGRSRWRSFHRHLHLIEVPAPAQDCYWLLQYGHRQTNCLVGPLLSPVWADLLSVGQSQSFPGKTERNTLHLLEQLRPDLILHQGLITWWNLLNEKFSLPIEL